MIADKPFSEYTQEDVDAMTKEELRAVPPEEKRSCYDCAYLKPALSWWCTNNEAIEMRGTSIPGCIKCPFWEKKVSIMKLSWWRRLFS